MQFSKPSRTRGLARAHNQDLKLSTLSDHVATPKGGAKSFVAWRASGVWVFRPGRRFLPNVVSSRASKQTMCSSVTCDPRVHATKYNTMYTRQYNTTQCTQYPFPRGLNLTLHVREAVQTCDQLLVHPAALITEVRLMDPNGASVNYDSDPRISAHTASLEQRL